MPTIEQMNKWFNQKAPGTSTSNYFKFPRDTSVIEFKLLPPWPGSELPFVFRRSHYFNSVRKRYECLIDFGMSCPICDAISRNLSVEAATQGQSRQNALMNVLIVAADESFDPTKIYRLSGGGRGLVDFLHQKTISGEIQAFINPENSFNIVMNRTRDDGPFNIQPKLVPTPINPDPAITQHILSSLPNLDNECQISDSDVQENTKAAQQMEMMWMRMRGASPQQSPQFAPNTYQMKPQLPSGNGIMTPPASTPSGNGIMMPSPIQPPTAPTPPPAASGTAVDDVPW